MALPSGNFSRSQGGPLQVVFSGQWTATSFDFGGGAPSDLVIKCTVTDGTTTKTGYINLRSASLTIDWDYVASSTLTCSMTEEWYHIDGPGYVTANNLRIRAILMKR